MSRSTHFTWAFIGVLASATFVYAGFSTSEFGEGSFDTGSTATIVNDGGEMSYPSSASDPVVVANLAASSPQACTETWAVNHCTELGLTGNIAQSNISSLSNYELAAHDLAIDGQFSKTNYPGFAGLDTNNDGYVSNSEIVTYLSQTSGVTFDGTYAEQAIQIFKQLGDSSVCSGDPDAACIQTAINNTNDFAAELLESATTGGVAADLSDAASELASGDIDVSAGADNERLAAFDRNNDGTLTGAEIVALLASDPTAGASVTQPSGDAGLYARAYLEELAQCSTIDSACIQTAVTAGNDWAVHPPQILHTAGSSDNPLTLVGTASDVQTDAFTVYDGTCAAGASCVTAPENVSYSVRTTFGSTVWEAADASNPFTVDSNGRVIVNASATNITDVEDLDSGTYTIEVTAEDDNDDSYNKTATASSMTLTVSNQNGCILNNGIQSNQFVASGNIQNAAVTISGNFDSSHDLIFVKGATATNVNGGKKYTNFGYSGITADYTESSGMLRFSGTTTLANWIAIFKKVGYIFNSQNAAADDTRSLIFSLSDTVPYLHDNGTSSAADDTYHYYEYVANNGIDFSPARVAAGNRSLFGLRGYLVTVTSQAEQDYIEPKIQGLGWMGACDDLGQSDQTTRCGLNASDVSDLNDHGDSGSASAEGKWYWIDGPERLDYMGQDRANCSGTQNSTYNQPSTYNHSTAFRTVNSDTPYNNFKNCEPNNYLHDSNGEAHLHFYSNGDWNDYRHNDNNIKGYIVEYGGPSTDGIFGTNSDGSVPDITETHTYTISTDADFCAYAQ